MFIVFSFLSDEPKQMLKAKNFKFPVNNYSEAESVSLLMLYVFVCISLLSLHLKSHRLKAIFFCLAYFASY